MHKAFNKLVDATFFDGLAQVFFSGQCEKCSTPTLTLSQLRKVVNWVIFKLPFKLTWEHRQRLLGSRNEKM